MFKLKSLQYILDLFSLWISWLLSLNLLFAYDADFWQGLAWLCLLELKTLHVTDCELYVGGFVPPLCCSGSIKHAFLSEETRLWRIKPFPFRRSKILRGMKCAVSIQKKLTCRRQRAEWVSQRICNATPTLILLRPANEGLEVQRSVWATVKTCPQTSPVIILSLHPNLDVKRTVAGKMAGGYESWELIGTVIHPCFTYVYITVISVGESYF